MKKDSVGNTVAFITHPEAIVELYQYLDTRFDEDCAAYTKQYYDLKAQLKYVRKYIAIKLAVLPAELVLGYLLLGRLEVRARIKLAKKLFKAFKAQELTPEQISELYELC